MEWARLPSALGKSPSVQYGLVTVSLAGVQFVWSIEQSYVNIYLMELGMTKAMLSIMWIACPLCGLVVQPVVGILSDYNTSSVGRRRPYMIWGSIMVVASLLAFAWAPEIGHKLGFSPLILGMVAVICIDVSINICQSCCRALVVDIFPGKRQADANGWAGFMASSGHLVSYLLASCDLTFIGFSNQLKAVCVLYSAVLIISIGISSASVSERVLVSSLVPSRPKPVMSKIAGIFRLLWNSATTNLDSRMRSIFRVQMFAWYSWFTFLFYGATYAAEVWGSTQRLPPDTSELARKGSLALTVFSLSATIFSSILPRLPFAIHNIWAASFLIYSFAVLCTRFVRNFETVLVLFAFVGITWAATLWIPFSLTAERIHGLPLDPSLDDNAVIESSVNVIHNYDQESQRDRYSDDHHYESRNHGSRANRFNGQTETTSLIPDVSDGNIEHTGLYLGIHNASVTIPQFVSTFGSYIIFKLMDVDPQNPHMDGGKTIAITLQVGAVASLLAALYATKINEG